VSEEARERRGYLNEKGDYWRRRVRVEGRAE